MPLGHELSWMTDPAMSRRRLVAGVGALFAGGSLLNLMQACGSGAATSVASPGPSGSVRGSVVDMLGKPQGIGRIYLLKKNGFNTGTYADVDAAGRFDFGNVSVGEYLLRYWGSNQAEVPESLHNPVRIFVAENAATAIQFQVVVAVNPNVEREIYIGDYFFQEQPIGAANDMVTVTLGTIVCWYNVGRVVHDVVGGPWGDSGPIGEDANFMWKSDRLGTFPYRCSLHETSMIASLQVVP